jgi:hypothetical protein
MTILNNVKIRFKLGLDIIPEMRSKTRLNLVHIQSHFIYSWSNPIIID